MEAGRDVLAQRRRRLTESQLAILQMRLRGSRDVGGEQDATPGRWPQGTAARLSSQQERFWFLAQMDPRADAPICARFRGPLDLQVFERSLTALVERHEVLRTRFSVGSDGVPRQYVDPAYQVSVRFEEVGTASEPESELHARIALCVQNDFDFSNSHLPFTLFRLGADDHVLFVPMQHANIDGSSVEILLHELSALYRAELEGTGASLSPLAATYAGYAEWQQARAETSQIRRQLDYWVRQLSDVPLSLDLPVDRPRLPGRRPVGADVALDLPASLRRGITARCSEEHVTSFMLLLAAFQVVVLRYTGARRFVVGCPVAGRTVPETESLVGCFINTLPMRADLVDDDERFSDLLGRVRRTALDAYDHQDVPIEKVIETLRPSRDSVLPPMSHLWFDMRSFHQPVSMPQIHGELVTVVPPPRFDLAVVIRESESQLSIAVEYPEDLFDAQTVQGMLDTYRAVLEAAVRDPQCPLRDLLAPSGGTRQEHGQARHNLSAPLPGHSFFARFLTAAHEQPQAPAVCAGDQTLTYRYLERRSVAVAARLLASGASAGATVGLLTQRGPDMLVALLGILGAGCAYLPLGDGTSPERSAELAAAAGLRHVLTTSADLTADLVLPEGAVVVTLPEEHAPSTRQTLAPAPMDAPAYVLFTSGTQGMPKAVVVDQAALASYLDAALATWPMGLGDRQLALAALDFDASVHELLIPLACGACVVLAEEHVRGDGPALARALTEGRITHLVATPTTLRLLADTSVQGLDTCLLSVGETLPVALAAALFKQFREVWNCYGTTETTVLSTAAQVRTPVGTRVPVGRPLPNSTVFVLDERGTAVPPGVVGEVWIGGSGVARGYLGDPKATTARFVPEPQAPGTRRYRTGDLGRVRADGQLEILGRTDNQLKINGIRIEAAEVERSLLQLPGVTAAAVQGRAEVAVPGGLQLVGYLVPRPGVQLDPTALLAELRRRLPRHLCPHTLLVLDALPVNRTGAKVDLAALPAPHPTLRPASSRDGAVLATTTEEIVLTAFRQVLGTSDLGVSDDFFLNGGRSLLAAAAVHQLNGHGLQATVRDLFDTPTARTLAARLQDSPERKL